MWYFLMSLAFAIGTFVTSASANGYARGVFCDEASQVESYLRLVVEKKLSLKEAVEATNEAAGSPSACILGLTAVVDPQPVKEVLIEGQHIVIVRLIVVALGTPDGMMPVPPLVQYIAIGKESDVKPSADDA